MSKRQMERTWQQIVRDCRADNAELCGVALKSEQMKQNKQNSFPYLLIVVGVVSAFGPFVTDFYLPALPALSEYFQTTTSLAQMSLTVSMIGLAIGQLFIGPLSDRYGRKRPLMLTLVLFVFSTVGCLLSPGIMPFLAFRFIQGLAGAGGVVISKSIATDLYEGRQLARFFSMLSSVQGLAPICAPVLGGILLTVTDWRGIFEVLLALGVVLLIAFVPFRESLRRDPLASNNVRTAFKAYLPVLRNRTFVRYVLVQAAAMGVMFTYIAASPFIFQQHYGLSVLAYSLCFGLNALGIMGGSLSVVRFPSITGGLKAGAAGFLTLSVVTVVTMLVGLSVVWVEASFFLTLVCLGMILPTSTTLALEPVRANSGNASAVLGFLTFFVGGVCSPLAGMGNMLYSTSALIVICAVATCYGAFGRDKGDQKDKGDKEDK